MTDLRELYQDLILDHGRNPRNFRPGGESHRLARGHNPLCGDQIDLWVRVGDDGLIEDLCFQGKGCAISTSSASLMTQVLKDQPVERARELFERFHDLITATGEPDTTGLGKLAVFAGVRDYPTRAKCATLAWHTLKAALDQTEDPVSTE